MIQFTKPLFLLLLIPLIYYSVAMSRRSLAGLSTFRSRLALGLRLAIIVLLVFALAGARMVKEVSQQCVVFVLDVSDSIPKAKQDEALAYINSALKNIQTDQKAGLVVFGSESSVELAPSNVSKIDKIYSITDTSNTDISQALGLAMASFPENSAKKIVLLSDGNETLGKAVEQAMLAGSDNVSIDVVPIASDLPKEALLDKMICPNSVKIGEPFDVKLVAVSKQPTVARLRMYRSGKPVGEKVVDLPKGKSVLTFQQSIDKAGSYQFQAILDCDSDPRVENNVALGYTSVKGKPKVLYVEGAPGQEKYLANALKSTDIEVDVRDRSGIPNTLAELRGYDMLVMSDIPAWNLAAEQMTMVQSAVKDLGMGFTMIGGEQSFGAGGYYDTPIEKALPVDMSVRKTKVLPSLSVVVVMDKSGSMGAPEGGKTKMQLANDAAAAVVKLLQPVDKVGVVICHSFPVTAVKLQPAAKKGQIYREISTIRAEGGGISVFPSLQMAYDMIKGSGTRQKHIILLADGADCDDQQGCVPLAHKMANERITVTTVAIGDGPHIPFLKNVATAGKGDYYLARRAQDLKAIFTKDVMTISKSLVIEEPFVPRMDTSNPVLSNIDTASTPPLLGYVATSIKPAAMTVMESHKKDPILATWQYGLGKSAAFTSDCKARWAARWLGWPEYNRLWAQVLRSTMRKSAATDFQTTVDISGGTGRVVIDAVDDKGNFLNFMKFAGSVVGPNVTARAIAIEQTGPGRYEASFDAREVGTYLVNVLRKDKDQGAPETNVVSIPYPLEYKDFTPNVGLLKRLASETGGTVEPDAKDIFARNFRKSRAYSDLWRLLTLIAVLILPVDVAVRRLSMSPQQVVELFAAIRAKLRLKLRRSGQSKQAERVETVGSLLKVKKQLSQSADHDHPEPIKINVPPAARRTPQPDAPAGPADPAAPEPPDAPAPEAPPEQAEPEKSAETSTTSRLLEAKRRARKE